MEGEALIIRLRAVFQDSIYLIAVDLAVSNGRVKRETSMMEDREARLRDGFRGHGADFTPTLPSALHKKLSFAQHLRISSSRRPL
jgi:hypothetical protein